MADRGGGERPLVLGAHRRSALAQPTRALLLYERVRHAHVGFDVRRAAARGASAQQGVRVTLRQQAARLRARHLLAYEEHVYDAERGGNAPRDAGHVLLQLSHFAALRVRVERFLRA